MEPSSTHDHTILSEFRANAERVRSNRDFTPQGQQHRLAELAVDAANRLEVQRKVLRDYDQRITAESAKLTAATTRTREDVLVTELRAQEIRKYVNTLDPLELQARYIAAASDPKYYELMLAVESAPLQMLSDDVLAEGKALRMAAPSPEQSRLIRELQAMRKAVADAIESGMAMLHSNGLPADDPISQLARGTTTAA
jgi:molecular chaperone GrpE (heat shock protein)